MIRLWLLLIGLLAPVLTLSEAAAKDSRADQLVRFADEAGIEIRGLRHIHGDAIPPGEDGRQPTLEALLEGLGHTILFDDDGRIKRIVILRTRARRPSLEPPPPEPADPTPMSAEALALGERLLGKARKWRLSSGFGWRNDPISGVRKFHKGVDFSARAGMAVLAFADGEVVARGRRSGYGRALTLEHADGSHTFYGHLSGFAEGLEVGGRVEAGQIIGGLGNSGRSTGPHLHFELLRNGQPIDPLKDASLLLAREEDAPQE